MAVRLDVHVFISQEERAKKTNCVPLKEFDISTKTLSDIRKALIVHGGLDASRAGSAFCSAAGAQVNDSASFTDYLEILSEDKEKMKEEKEEKKNKEDNAKSDKPAEVAKVTVHNVYLKTKEKKSIDRTGDMKEFIKQELNLKLSDKPELLKASLEQLASSFNHADWVAASNETSINLAGMSEKDWNTVIGNNNLLSAHRLVFSNLGQLNDGKKAVKFRRIERAPYSAFVLKPRTFAGHEIPDADVKVDQVFRIPRFTVSDDSYIDVFETKSSVASAMARSSFSSIEAEASMGGGAFGVTASVSSGFSESESNALSTQSTVDSSTMNITYNFPRVVIYLDQFGVEVSKECADDILEVKDASSLVAFHYKYGHFFTTRIELGGRLFSSEKFSALGSKTEDEAATAMKIAAAASFSSMYASGSVGFSHEKQENSDSSKSNRSMQRSISWQAHGGDTLLCNNPPAWCPTVSPPHNWRVIKQEDVTPLGDFIGQIAGYEDIPARFRQIAEFTRKKEIVSFRLSLEKFEKDAQSKAGYLALHHAWKIKNEVEAALSENPKDKFDIGLIQLIPEHIMYIYNSGYPGLFMSEDNSYENVFDIEVETLLNQTPTMEFRKRYHIYNRKRGLWLQSFSINIKNKEVTFLAAGPKSQATLFEFRNEQREGPVQDGDSCSLIAYGPDGRLKGLIAHPLEAYDTSIGVMPLTSSNKKWLLSSTLKSVDQRDVPT